VEGEQAIITGGVPVAWEQLEFDIADMFAEHSLRQYEQQSELEFRMMIRIAQKREHERTPRARHLKKIRMSRWRQTEDGKRRRRESMQRWREKNKERLREYKRPKQRQMEAA
jgi:hypothetical protein